MKDEGDNIFSVFDEVVPRAERERFLNQRACVLWMTGLSGSGKTTLAKHLERQMLGNGFFPVILDGDNLRTGLCKGLGFDDAGREENIRRVAEVAKLFVQAGAVVICTFVSPTRAIRELARNIIGEEDFIEIYVSTDLATCESRDPKGLYARARAGEITDFTGVSAPFEAPVSPAVTITTAGRSAQKSGDDLYQNILPFITY